MSNVVGMAPLTGTDSASAGETTVLIVDDHRCYADLLSAALETVPGIRCLGTATSGAEGIAQVHELSPSVVMMDIEMLGMDGLVATRLLREASPQTPVVVVSAHQDDEWVEKAAEAGAAAFVTKGGPLAEMITVLRAAKPGPVAVPAPLPSAGAVQTVDRGVQDDPSVRQPGVRGLIAKGLQARSIAKVMGISVQA